MDITIRPATPEDAATVLDLTRKLADYVDLLDQVTATVEDIRHAMTVGRIEAALAETGTETGSDGSNRSNLCKKTVGGITYYEKFSTFSGRPKLYLEDLFVDPTIRGQGIGLRLMRYYAQVALQRGCNVLEWQVVKSNTPAMAFYQHLGANDTSDWTNWGMSPAMTRRLAELDDC